MLASMLGAPSCSTVQSGAARGSNETQPPLIAIGVLSAPHFVERRDSLRSSWMRSSLVGRGRPARVLFVVRAKGMPSGLDCQLAVEQRVNDDIMRAVTVPWNESPSYSVRVAPGKHGAMSSGSLRAFHASSIGAAIVNLFSSCIFSAQPPRTNAGAGPGGSGAGAGVGVFLGYVSRPRPAPHDR